MAAPGKPNPQIDAYIEKAQPFAQPILLHLRALVHKACPGAEEALKWSMPFFVYKGINLANMAGFKQHCSFGFWGKEISAVLREEAAPLRDDALGSLGRITSVKDLPSDKKMLGWIGQAAGFIDAGAHTSPMAGRAAKPARAPLATPPALAAAFKKNKKAAEVFENFSPSCRREYIEWINEAKREETREKRVATAVEWIAEGKQRNWKYQ